MIRKKYNNLIAKKFIKITDEEIGFSLDGECSIAYGNMLSL